jgi:ubiquinone/menaquinone biosynthesis C-methylase UbiE
MSIIVEIGCGTDPGPRFEEPGAAESLFYATDISETKLDLVEELHPEMIPLQADAANLPFDDESIDIVLARNVFGHPNLIYPDDAGPLALNMMLDALESGQPEAFKKISDIGRYHSDLLKDRILDEASRVLVAAGKLIIVEHLSPRVTKEYLARRQTLGGMALRIEETDLAAVAPPNYQAAHKSKFPFVWLGTKA